MPFKPQDILFLFVLFLLLIKRDPKIAAAAGLASLIISIPLFAKYVFFTAERLTWYAFAFFLLALLLNIKNIIDNKDK